MLTTEEDARKKLCPYMSANFLESCRASACMAWRWSPSLTIDNPNRIPGTGQTIKHERGYCGAAARPREA